MCPGLQAGCSSALTASPGFSAGSSMFKKSYWCDFVSEGKDYFTCKAKADITPVGAAALFKGGFYGV